MVPTGPRKHSLLTRTNVGSLEDTDVIGGLYVNREWCVILRVLELARLLVYGGIGDGLACGSNGQFQSTINSLRRV